MTTDYRTECELLVAQDVQVHAFYMADRARESFDEIAALTGGASQPLDVSDADALTHAVCETALGDIGGTAMQRKYKEKYRAQYAAAAT